MHHASLALWLSVAAANPVFPQGAPLLQDREQAAVATLPDGRVWVLGGQSVDAGVATLLPSTELYDPDAGSWSAGPDLSQARQGATALLLANGDLLACGGKVGTTLSTHCDYFTSADGGFFATSAVSGTGLPARPSLAPMDDGTILVAGGALYAYDPSTDTFSQPGDLPNYTGRVAVRGLDGTIYLAETTAGDLLTFTNPNNITDQGTLPFNPTSMGVLGTGEVVLLASNGQAALITPPGNGLASIAPVPNGNGQGVLVPAWAGGLVLIGSTTAFWLDPTSHTWATAGDLSVPRTGGVGAKLPDGRVLYAGGRTGAGTSATSLATTDLLGLLNGVACGVAGQCLSVFCEGGTCCGSACPGSCQTCATGTCQQVAVGAPGSCGGTGSCAGTCAEDAGCVFPPACEDAGPPDAGPPDAGPEDAGPPDAGPPVDAGPTCTVATVATDCPSTASACAATCVSGHCAYPSASCGPCQTCDTGACIPDPAGTDPHGSCGGVGTCAGSCDGDAGCNFPTAACSDGDICTENEHCQLGQCVGGNEITNCCHTASDCPSDAGECAATCDSTNRCSYPTTSCGDCHRCQVGSCIEDDTLTCSDNNFCTPNDRCVSGACVADPVTAGCCNFDSECPAGTDACKRPTCDSHACTQTQIAGCCLTDADCDDQNPDTVERCLAHVCQYYLNVPDAGPVDAGPEDAGPADAGHDGGHVGHDGGHDAGHDAGPVDAGPQDAGPPDAGEVDAGADGGSTTKKKTTGCSCNSPAGAADLAWLAPILLAGLNRRRRRE